MKILKSPFPWFGGKSKVADIVWERFGDVPNYCEPFAGSLAVLLGRPHAARVETVNDKDAYLANFWRALQADPEAVAHHADWPVNEADLRSRHLWLVIEGKPIVDKLMSDPDFYDVKIAGWWVWGLSQHIGGEWCTDQRAKQKRMPDMTPGKGVHRPAIHAKRPRLGSGGTGIHRTVWHSVPHLSGGGMGIKRTGVSNLQNYLLDLAERLRRVRVCCGDWSRIVKPSATIQIGLTGILLDPPYSNEADRDMGIYFEDCGTVAHKVREWAIANGDNPLLRIALCGYEGEHNLPPTWDVFKWESSGGYSSLGKSNGKVNRKKERIWFSPHCLKRPQLSLFDFREEIA